MAEVILVGTSVIAIIQIADRVIDLCKFYIRTVQDFSSDLRLILLETSMVKTIIENLRFFLTECKGQVSNTMSNLLSDDGPVEGCCRSIIELEKLFPSDLIRMQRNWSKKRRVQATLTALQWPLKANRARKLVDEMACYKKTITLALTTESM